MAFQKSLGFLVFLLLIVNPELSGAQHWSHGWYPGGKRELDVPQSPLVSEELKLCEGENCMFLRSSQKDFMRSFLTDMLVRRIQKKK
ncbi:progonadoliberin-2 [Pristis pectinata]|uniref:progonadoliberin-2 n=1 Tax=Pristis pectinata TaxID=685728 RepID=UPI00223E21F1|nr:progonadoliberin-2 [Pristis pectinata]